MFGALMLFEMGKQAYTTRQRVAITATTTKGAHTLS